MSFKALRIVSESEVEITFEGDDGTPAVHVFTLQTVGPGPGALEGLLGINGDDDFTKKYRGVPGPHLPMWPEQLVGHAHRAALQALPAGETLRRLIDESTSACEAA